VATSRSGWFPRRDPSSTAEDPRVLSLEADVRRLREQLAARPSLDVTQLDELELTQVASETAVTIVRAAHRRRDELLEESERLVRESGLQATAAIEAARTQVEQLRSEIEASAEEVRRRAEERAEALRADADAYASRARSDADGYASNVRVESDGYASRVRMEADEYGSRVRRESDDYASTTRRAADEQATVARAALDAEQRIARERFDAEVDATRAEIQAQVDELFAQAEQAIADARERAKGIEAEGMVERERILAEAYERRDALLETIEKQRRWVNVLVQDAGELRSNAVRSFDEVRSLIDSALSRLTAPAEGADRVLSDIDTEVARISRQVDELSADASRQTPPSA
jgi:hypothetical protein